MLAKCRVALDTLSPGSQHIVLHRYPDYLHELEFGPRVLGVERGSILCQSLQACVELPILISIFDADDKNIVALLGQAVSAVEHWHLIIYNH